MCARSSSVRSSFFVRSSSTIRRPDACPVDSPSASFCPTACDSSVSSHFSSSAGVMLTTSPNSFRIVPGSSSAMRPPLGSTAPVVRPPVPPAPSGETAVWYCWSPHRPPEESPVSVTVVGSVNEDVLVAVDRLPGRGETVVGRSAVLAPGGKGANQAAAAGELGPGVHMVGRVGEDPAGDRQLAALAGSRVNVSRVHRTPGVPTGSATIPVEEGSGENLIVVVPGANAELTAADADADSVRRATVLLLQLEVPLPTVEAAARAASGTVVLTPAPPQALPESLLELVDVLLPNEHE